MAEKKKIKRIFTNIYIYILSGSSSIGSTIWIEAEGLPSLAYIDYTASRNSSIYRPLLVQATITTEAAAAARSRRTVAIMLLSLRPLNSIPVSSYSSTIKNLPLAFFSFSIQLSLYIADCCVAHITNP